MSAAQLQEHLALVPAKLLARLLLARFDIGVIWFGNCVAATGAGTVLHASLYAHNLTPGTVANVTASIREAIGEAA